MTDAEADAKLRIAEAQTTIHGETGPCPPGVDPAIWHALEQWVPQRSRLAQRVRRQLLWLYALLVIAFLLLAYRSEQNARDIRTGLWDTCNSRATIAAQTNPGRIALIELLQELTDQSRLTPGQKDAAQAILQEGLVVAVIDCGERP